MEKLGKDFYMQDTLTVARSLLGKLLVHETADYSVAGRIVETEAYIGPEDKASHSYGGRRTSRNEVMYLSGGVAYIYFIYGMYYCFNVVTEAEEKPAAVLIRALEPVSGIDAMARFRYGIPFEALSPKQKLNLTNGPGKLCKAMGIGRELNGIDLCGNELYICDSPIQPFNIMTSPRINIDYAEEYRNKPWRFYIQDNKYVSKP